MLLIDYLKNDVIAYCFIALFFIACSGKNINNEILKDVVYLQKPVVNTMQDAQNAYITLYEAYIKNLNILEFLNDNTKGGLFK